MIDQIGELRTIAGVTYRLVQRTRDDADFYTLMGRFFGSRAVAKALGMPMYDDPDRVWCIIHPNDRYRPVACASLAITGRKAALKSAWVDPEVRGIGLYDWLFATRLAIAQARGITTLTATATAYSKATHERYGFRLTGMRGQYFLFRKDLP